MNAIDRYDRELRARDRVDELIRREDRIRTGTMRRLVSVLLQRPEPHAFHTCHVAPRVSPRRASDIPAQPGGTDNTGFSEGIC